MNLLLSTNTYITLTSNINSSQTTIPVSSITDLPAVNGDGRYFYLDIIDEAGNYETVKVTNISGLNLITVRGRAGTIAKSFNSNSSCGLRIGKAVTDDLITAIDNRLALSGGTLTGDLTLFGLPSNPNHAASKAYVDAVKTGLDPKDSVRVATTTNITLYGQQTIDGVVAQQGDRILVKDQADDTTNGIYVISNSNWTRATDADSNSKVTSGMYCFVEEGTINGNTGWILTSDGAIILGTSSLNFVQFTGVGELTVGDGLLKTGINVTLVTATSARIAITSNGIDLAVIPALTPGNYTSVSVDAYGRVNGGSIPTTLAGYSINDAAGILNQLLTVDGINSLLDADKLDGNESTYYTNASNIVSGILGTARLPAFTGDVTSSEGSNSLTLNNSGISGGSFTKLTVNTKGIAIAGSNPTTLAGYNISDASGLLSQLITVDGSNSGLDADKLDGYEGSSYARLSNNETITGQWTITNNTASTSYSTGALVISGGLGVGGSANINGNITVNGDLTVNGTTSTIQSIQVNIEDPIFTLGGTTAPSTDDNKDRGIQFRWHDGLSAKIGFFGFDDSTGKFTFIPDATNTSEVFSGTPGELVAQINWANITGVTPTFTEINYVSGVTSSIQDQLGSKQTNITGAATSITSVNLTGNKVVISDSAGKVASSSITSTELEYLQGTTSKIQDQIDALAVSSSVDPIAMAIALG